MIELICKQAYLHPSTVFIISTVFDSPRSPNSLLLSKVLASQIWSSNFDV